MSDAYEVYPTQTVIKCDECGDSFNVDWFCKNCPGSLYETCKDRHKTRAITSKHSVVPRTQTVVRSHGPDRIAEQCPRHKGKDISIYCKQCKVACCAKCHVNDHKLHDFSPIEDVYIEKEKTLNAYIKELEHKVQKKIDDLIDTENHDNIEQESLIENEIDDVNDFRKEIKKEVDVQCDSLIDTLRKSNVDKTNIITELQKQKQNVDRLIRECKEKIWEGNIDLIEYCPPSPNSLVPDQPSNSCVKAKFVRDIKVLDNIRKGLGRIKFWDTDTNENNAACSKQLGQFYRSHLQVQKVKQFTSKIDGTSIIMAGKNRAWIADYDSDTMHLYDNNGKMIRSVTAARDVAIEDTAVTPSGDVIVTNQDKKVRRVEVDGTVTTLIDIAPFKPWGLCLTDTGQIVVCITGYGEDSHIAMYTPDGRNKVSEIRGGTKNKRVITNSYRVIQNGKDFCAVNFYENVVCVNQTGVCQWTYDGRSAGLMNKFSPKAICCDKYHNLLVSDFQNSCVHYIDREGQLIQVILTKVGLDRPSGIGVDDETGKVWIGDLRKKVIIAKYIK